MVWVKRLCFLSLLLAVILAGAGCGGGGTPPAPGSVDGYVYATNGGVRSLAVRGLLEDAEAATLIPIAGATVTVAGVDTTTDVNGFFRIDNIDPGTYSVTIQSTGYDTLTINSVGITSGNVTHLNERNITMAQKAWNFLVYLDGDNTLEPFAISDLNEMEQVGSSANVNVLVLIDRIPGYDASNGDWTSTRLYYVTQDANASTISSTLLVDFGELDMSDPNTLRDFVIYCQEHFPAQKTCLTLWNHGNGVWPRAIAQGATKKQPKGGNAGGKDGTGILGRGICWDDSSTTGFPWNCLTTDEVADALAAARAATGQKIDVINMDACLTQMLEVAYEWKNEADYLVGSEATVPGDGNAYNTVLAHLAGNSAMSASSLATTLVDDYYAYYNGLGATTYSAINLGSSFSTLISAFSTFATALKNTSEMTGVLNAWANTTFFTFYELNDLYDFADETIVHVAADAAVTSAAASLKTAISNAVIHHHETGGYVAYAYGIGILLPSSSEWPYYSNADQYVLLDLSVDTDWYEFIENFVAFY